MIYRCCVKKEISEEWQIKIEEEWCKTENYEKSLSAYNRSFDKAMAQIGYGIDLVQTTFKLEYGYCLFYFRAEWLDEEKLKEKFDEVDVE